MIPNGPCPGARAARRGQERASWPRGFLPALAAAVFAVVYVGWSAFWFLTDDAFIAFRYVGNHLAGFGWVWNPPPFQPVEGYTSFLWVVLLEGVWRVTGVAPPEAANWISLAFGYATFYLVFRIAARMQLPASLERWRPVLLVLVLLGTVSNRTFLTWLSSGMETALFNFCFTAWIACALVRPAARGRSWSLRLSASAALARPDGLLAVAGSIALLALDGLRRPGRARGLLLGSAPLLAVPAHLAWRRATYGLWLPNTYYAKYVGPWSASGVRYALCFAVEYGVWVWIALALVWLVRELRRADPRRWLRSAHAAVAVAAVVGHAAYYTFVIGGDHFEYRVYSHLIALLYLSAAWMASRVTRRPAVAIAWLALLLLAATPIPWLHWAKTRHLTRRDATFELIHPVAWAFPWPLRPLVARWDGWQAWLIRHSVGNRHQEHKVFQQRMAGSLPSREQGSRIGWQERATWAVKEVGRRAWVAPGVAIIDLKGLNDAVIARQPLVPGQLRKMAHARFPPRGYAACFRPNVVQDEAERSLRVRARSRPLADDEIRACETRDWPTLRERHLRARARAADP